MPGGSKKGGGLESSPTYKKKSMAYNKKAPFKMKGHTLPGPAQRRATMSGDPAFSPDAEAMEDTMAMKTSPAKDPGWKHFAGTDFLSKEAKTKAIKDHNKAYGSGHTTHGEQNPKGSVGTKKSMAKGKFHPHSDHHASEGKGESVMPTPPPPERQAIPKKKSMAKHIDGFEDTLPHKHRGRKVSRYVKKKKR